MIAVVFVILIIGGNCRNGVERWHEYGGANYRRTQRDSRGTALSLPRTKRIEPLHSHDKDIGHLLQADSPAFTLSVTKYLTTGTVMPQITLYETGVNEKYIVDDADRIELTCMATQHKLNKWISNKISTPIKSSYNSALVIYPDVDDINQTATCERDDSKNITVKLTTTNIAKIRQDAAIPIYLPKGANWHNASCYGHEPTNIYKFKPGNQVMIENFDAHMNGTIYYCINYKIQTKVLSGKNIQPNGPMYERVKTKYVFYLKSKRMNNPETEGARESGTQTKEENNNGNDSGPSAIAIVGGVLGSIIFILLGILMCVCYKIQQRRPDDEATQVVYAEIEQRSATAPLPPPRNQAPYAMIIGILTPKQPPQTKSPSDYTYSTAKCQVTRAENPYCVVE